MKEYLDYYDENHNFLGKEERKVVHEKALWHDTVHCWLYDKEGNIYFQIRKDENKLYTTASGHILAGETIKEGFKREIKEEIGLDIDYNKVTLVNVVKFTLDRENKDGTIFRDRAFANVYICPITDEEANFHFDTTEVLGVVKIKAKKTIELLNKKIQKVKATTITYDGNKLTQKEKFIKFDDFLVNKGETAITKYGEILKKIVEITTND